MAQPHLLIAAGGTGGHMFPAQALAEEMLRRGWRVTLSTDARGARYTDGFPAAVTVRQVASATFARGGLAARLAVPFRIAAGILAARRDLRRDRPDAVIGFGGYPSIPALAAAWLTGLPRMIHEQNGVLGRVNQLFARRVDRVACGTWPTALPAGIEGIHTGNPVRDAVLRRAGAPYIAPGDYPLGLVVIGGSQGARILSQRVPPALALLPQDLRARLRVAQQTREEDRGLVLDTCARAGIAVEIAPFFADIPARISEAQLVISRAGASSVADLTVIGRPSILVPLASAIRDEQSANARALVEAQAAVAIPEDRLDPQFLADEIASILLNPDKARAMADAALSLGRPDAAVRLADLVTSLAVKDPR